MCYSWVFLSLIMLDLSNKESLYSIFYKKKKSGKYRKIYSPCKELKEEQYKIVKKYGAIYEPPEYVYGFINGRCSAICASNHVKKDWVLTVDIKDFFPSITSKYLKQLELTDYEIDICTLDDKLIQGSPASPLLSNMIFRPLDDLFYKIFKNKNICYSRYCDDIIISGYGQFSWNCLEIISTWCAIWGFEINNKKIKFMPKSGRQTVLGINVNDCVSINRQKRKLLRSKKYKNNLNESDIGYLSYINGVNKWQNCN